MRSMRQSSTTCNRGTMPAAEPGAGDRGRPGASRPSDDEDDYDDEDEEDRGLEHACHLLPGLLHLL